MRLLAPSIAPRTGLRMVYVVQSCSGSAPRIFTAAPITVREHFRLIPPPYPISLIKSLRDPQNFRQVTSSETIFGGSQKMVFDGPSSRGFAFLTNPKPLAICISNFQLQEAYPKLLCKRSTWRTAANKESLTPFCI